MSLPSGYKRLEYIQSTGTQYVDAGFKPTGSTKVVCDFQMLNQGSSQQGVFGSRPGTSGRFTVFTGNGIADLQVDYNTEQTLASVGSSITGLNVNSRTTLEVSNSLVINGTTVKTVSAASFASAYNLFLFANNNAGKAQLPGILKLYSCQIYDNGTLVRDFIPCKNTGGAVGLWDDVNSVFYGNAGTGTFEAGPIVVPLSEITELEYIQSNGTQYINTNIIPTTAHSIVFDFKFDSYINDTWGFSSFVDGNTRWSCGLFNNSFYLTGVTASQSSNLLTRTTFSGSCGFNLTYPLLLFAQNYLGSAYGYCSGRLYSCQIYDNGTLVRDFIPAKLADGTVGLYDKLNGLLYVNAGTGTFEAGPVVASPSIFVNIDGIWKPINHIYVNINNIWQKST